MQGRIDHVEHVLTDAADFRLEPLEAIFVVIYETDVSIPRADTEHPVPEHQLECIIEFVP